MSHDTSLQYRVMAEFIWDRPVTSSITEGDIAALSGAKNASFFL